MRSPGHGRRGWLALPIVIGVLASAAFVTGLGGSATEPTPNARFGIAAGSNLPVMSSAQLSDRLDAMRALGVGWVRFDVEWSNIGAKGPGQYDWTSYDRVTEEIVRRGMRPLGIVDYTPTWARKAQCVHVAQCAPRQATDFAQFAGDASAHFRGLGLHTWEIWNEPNVADYFMPRPNVAEYTAMLVGAYAAIKRADPNAWVVTGGTAPAATDGSNVAAPDFLRAVYLDGGKGSFDAVAHHPYTYPYTAANAPRNGAWGDLAVLHTIMDREGEGYKKVWATEYGAPTGGPGKRIPGGNGPFPDGSYHVSEDLQATMVNRAVGRYRTYDWGGPFFWYSDRDAGTSQDSSENFFGLRRADDSTKPAYASFRRAIQW